HGDTIRPRHHFHVRREPAHAEMLLQQLIDAVKGAAGFAAGNDELVARGAEYEAVSPQLVKTNLLPQRSQVRVVPEQDFTRAGALSVADNWELRSAHFLQVALQLLGGVAFKGRRVGGQDDAVLALAFAREDQFRADGDC